MGQWREVRASKASIKIDRSGVCHNVASVSRDYVPQVTIFPTGRYSVRLSHRPELAVPRGKESVATPQSAPRRTLRLGLVVRKNPLIGSPLWIVKKLLGIRLLFISPFSYFSKSLSIPFNCALLLRFSCGISNLGLPCLFVFFSRKFLEIDAFASFYSTPFNLCDSFLQHGSLCIGT